MSTSWMIFLFLALQVTCILSGFTDVPPPPTRPDRFNSREELKRYLQLVHEYYAIIGRPRFGRSNLKIREAPTDVNLFNFLDLNGDKVISYDEFRHQLGD